MKKEKLIGIGAGVLIMMLAVSPLVTAIDIKDDMPISYYSKNAAIDNDRKGTRDYFLFGSCRVKIENKNGITWPKPSPRLTGGYYLRYKIIANGKWTFHIDPLNGTDYYREGEDLDEILNICLIFVYDSVIPTLHHPIINSDPGFDPNCFYLNSRCLLAYGFITY
jgi:hypothetical protein